MIGKGRLSEMYRIYVKREREMLADHAAGDTWCGPLANYAASQKVRCVELMYRGWDDGVDDQLESALTVGERNR